MHWRLQKIMHGLSHFRHALTDRYPPVWGGVGAAGIQLLEDLPGVQVRPAEEGLVQVSFAGEQYFLRTSGSDSAVFQEIFLKGEYASLLRLLELNKIKVRTVADIGANIGMAARYFYRHLNPEKMVCLEPYEANAAVCKKNLEGCRGVTLLNKAVWRTPVATLHLHRHFRDGQDWSIAASESDGSLRVGKVEAITMHQLMQLPGFESIDLLKVDIEGGEQEIFAPDADTSFLEKVKVICVELHMEMIGYERIFETFRRHGFILTETSGVLLGVRR